MDEMELLSRLKDGDRNAFSEIYKLHVSKVLATAYYHLRDEKEAEKMAKKVFFKLWQIKNSKTLFSAPLKDLLGGINRDFCRKRLYWIRIRQRLRKFLYLRIGPNHY